MRTVMFVCFLLAAWSLGVVAAPVVQPKSPTSGTMADPEVQALVQRMYGKVQEMMAAGQELVQENDRLQKENATLRAKLGCS